MDLKRAGFVSIHTAESEPEAMVIRSLLEANGIHAPGPEFVNPLCLKVAGKAFQGFEVYVPKSQAGDARRTVAEYLEANAQDFSDFNEKPPRPVTSMDRKPRPKIS
jgi:hypothetical protein